MTTATAEYSAQEKATATGNRVLHGTVTDRVLRSFDTIRSCGPPRVALERAVYCCCEISRTRRVDPAQSMLRRWADADQTALPPCVRRAPLAKAIGGKPRSHGDCERRAGPSTCEICGNDLLWHCTCTVESWRRSFLDARSQPTTSDRPAPQLRVKPGGSR